MQGYTALKHAGGERALLWVRLFGTGAGANGQLATVLS